MVDYLMVYRSDGSAAFVGLERFTGRGDDGVRLLRLAALEDAGALEDEGAGPAVERNKQYIG